MTVIEVVIIIISPITESFVNSEHMSTSNPRRTRSRSLSRIKILTINCRSLRSDLKRCEFASILDTHQPNIINATKTHLNGEL